jgi:rhodanese-related sulfurtransferase
MTDFEDAEHALAPDEARNAIDSRGAIVIDVRQAYECEAGRIPQSRHIDMDHVAGEADTIPRGRPVIFYSRDGVRSALAARAFRDVGWDAYNLKGGLTAWAGSGLPLKPSSGDVAEH